MFSQIISPVGAPRAAAAEHSWTGDVTAQVEEAKHSSTKAQYSEMQITYLPKKQFDGFVAE